MIADRVETDSLQEPTFSLGAARAPFSSKMLRGLRLAQPANCISSGTSCSCIQFLQNTFNQL
ncbi:hypothetical protein I7I50_10477 [Histoplasma capsulatum G186AR]|uniref:Uncharacterized protein n=1 Tax=Ajellomyces capsulatus TaxID=5037 RepID=A0A8H8D6Q0_AJECA|nr:hypothetical protein I7I52_01716 [Histoplasma capsulatum]QSS69258.1 hypothetical protein I7I50_10477 [Histoplasma capsulatum G186AR]